MSQGHRQSASADKEARKPERKIGPFAGGIGVAIWLNTAESEDGDRQFRSITISPRRYQGEGGKWKDAKSFQPGDLPALIFALQKAQEYVFETPLPGHAVTDQGEVEETF